MIAIAAAATAAVLATVYFEPAPEPADWSAEAKKYQAECAGKTTQDCKERRWQIEYRLWQDLRDEYRGYIEVPEEVMDAALAAEVPQLKAWAIDRVGHRGIKSPAEKDLLMAALNDPYPVVREEAFDAGYGLNDERIRAMRERHISRRFPVHGYIADEMPASVEKYPGATYWYFASDVKRAFFTTKDGPDKVLAHFSKGGKRVLDAKQLEAELKKAAEPGDPMAMARAMQEAMAQGKNPQDVIMEMQNASPAAGDPFANLKDDAGVVAPKWVVLETASFMGKKVPSRFVMVFKDEKMGATSIVFPLVPKARPAPDFTDQKKMEREMKLQQELAPYQQDE